MLCHRAATWRSCSSGCETTTSAGHQGQDRSPGGAAVPPSAVCHQPATITPRDGDRTGAFPGKGSSRIPHSTLSQRFRFASMHEYSIAWVTIYTVGGVFNKNSTIRLHIISKNEVNAPKFIQSPAQKKQMEVLSFTDGDHQSGQQGDPPPDLVGCLYRDVLAKDRQNSPEASQEETSRTESVQSGDTQSSEETFIHQPEPQEQNETASLSSESQSDVVQAGYDRPPPPPVPRQLHINQPIRTLHGAVRVGSNGPLTITGAIETILDEEILKNRESDEGIRSIPRFQNYQPGKPTKVSTVLSFISHKACVPMETGFSC